MNSSAGSVRSAIISAAALVAICLVSLSARDAAGADPGIASPRANGVGAPIAWGVCDPPGPSLQCARIKVPDRVRAMLLDGVVDAVRYSKSAEERQAVFSEPSVDVFDQFLSLCDAAGPERCALAGGDETAAQRVDRLIARLKREPIQAPGANGTSLSRSRLNYGGLLTSQLPSMRAPATWPTNAANLAAALRGNGSQLQNAASAAITPDGWSGGSPRRRSSAPTRRPAWGPRIGWRSSEA